MKNLKNKHHYFLVTYFVLLSFFLFHIKDVYSLFNFILSIISPLILALGMAFVLNIPMTLIENKILFPLNKTHLGRKSKRTLAIILTLLLVFSIISSLLFFIIPQLIDSVKTLINSVPKYLETFEDMLSNHVFTDPKTFDIIWNELILAWEEIFKFAGQFFGFAMGHVVDFTINITSGIVNFALAIVFSVYMLSSKELFLKQLDNLLIAYTTPTIRGKILSLGKLTNVTFSKFIAGQCIEAIIIGILCFIGMQLLGIPYSLLISVIIGSTSLIPIFGAFIGTIPCIFIILIISPIKALLFLIFIIILQQLEGDFIYPRVVGNSVGLSPILVMFAMLVGGSAFGFLGLLLGIPTFGVIFKVFKNYTNSKLKEKKS